jgi:WS/DGAT/MGAT family acyltransferase
LERLSAEDTRILRLESDAIAGHTLKLAVVEPSGDGELLTLERVRARVAARLAAAPRARQRLAPTPLDVAPPAWVDDDAFDIGHHVRPASEPVANREALMSFVGSVMAERLDHGRPLWCIDVVGPTDEGWTALVIRIHHCMADGVTCLRMLSELLWDRDDDVEHVTPKRWSPAPVPGNARLLASGAAARLRGLGGGLAGGARAIVSPRRWRAAGRGVATLPGTLRRELWPLGADTAFDRRIGGDREVAFTACELDDLKRIEHAAGSEVTVNDVLLAVVAGAIRRWLGAHHEPMHAMRVQIPVSMHHRDEGRGELGNRDSFLFCDLPISEPDPSKRLAAINAETRDRKQHHDADELYSFFHSLSHVRPLYRVASGLASGPREFALSVSNVPGPREPVHVLGRPVSELYSVAEPADRHALRASAVSLAGRMGFGFCTDPGAVPGVTDLADGLDASLQELRALS